jgi:hypothetical protein
MSKYIYVRPVRNCTPVGCVAYTVDHDAGTITYQVSSVNGTVVEVNGKSTRDRFDRETARRIADEKFASDPIQIQLEDVLAIWDNKISNLVEEAELARSTGKARQALNLIALRSAELELIENSAAAAVMAAVSTDTKVPSRCNKTAKQWLRNIAAQHVYLNENNVLVHDITPNVESSEEVDGCPGCCEQCECH